MMIVLSHTSALEFWRFGNEHLLYHPERFPAADMIGEGVQNLSVSRIKRIRSQGFEFLSEPVHLLVPNAKLRTVRKNAVCHVCPKRVPRGSFIRISDDVYACRPEFAFVQTAHLVKYPLAVFTGLELCGAFRMPVGEQPVLFQGPPLTSAAALTEYLQRCGSMPGIVQAKRALRFIRDGSESPMEANLVILLCFPITLGGYGIPLPVLNQSIPTTEAIRKATGRSSYRCDLLWPEAGLAVEYDGAEHEGKVPSDSIRRTALAELGIHTMITVTKQQMLNQSELDLVVNQIKRCLGIDRRSTPCDWTEQRASLRANLNIGQ
ncbi:hypothetical protein [Raoultibacter phocaeensis]|uniref:hypothetical protein n=1 Tax=Raoultibacter phocaeensis TaxID=2479841 RepID=UPI00111A0A95|nr:hypothetical protein [Raoultibacter phocaeensis]